MSTRDIDSQDYNDTNVGIGFCCDTAEEKEIARLESKVKILTAELSTLKEKLARIEGQEQALIDAAREECAKVCDCYTVDDKDLSDDVRRAAKQIRSRIGKPLEDKP